MLRKKSLWMFALVINFLQCSNEQNTSAESCAFESLHLNIKFKIQTFNPADDRFWRS